MADSDADKDSSDYIAATLTTKTKRVSMTLVLPDTVKFHLAESRQIGRIIDSDLTLDARYESGLLYCVASPCTNVRRSGGV